MGVAWFSGWDVIVHISSRSVTYLVLVRLLLRVTGPRTLAKWYAFDLIVTVVLHSQRVLRMVNPTPVVLLYGCARRKMRCARIA